MLRLFVAVYPPREVAEVLRAEAAARPWPEVRWTAPERVHLTLLFLGPRSPRELDAIGESVAASVRGLAAFPLRPTRVEPLPRPGEARTIVAETDRPPTLLELHERLVRRLARRPSERPRDRFRPHLTLGRFRRPEEVPEGCGRALDGISFLVDAACLVASDLRPEGAVHRELARFPLGA